MIHSPDQIITWLCQHCQRDRVIQNAFSLPRVVEIRKAVLPGRWVVDIVSRRGVKYRVIIVMHSVTGEPERWYRVKENT